MSTVAGWPSTDIISVTVICVHGDLQLITSLPTGPIFSKFFGWLTPSPQTYLRLKKFLTESWWLPLYPIPSLMTCPAVTKLTPVKYLSVVPVYWSQTSWNSFLAEQKVHKCQYWYNMIWMGFTVTGSFSELVLLTIVAKFVFARQRPRRRESPRCNLAITTPAAKSGWKRSHMSLHSTNKYAGKQSGLKHSCHSHPGL